MSTIDTTTTTVRSADGTRIAAFRTGTGPAIILIDPALSTHKGSAKLAAGPGRALQRRQLRPPRARRQRRRAPRERAEPDREVEDIAALIDEAGGHAFLFGTSSGAALALHAAARLGDRVTGVVAYEPPYICDDSRPPLATDLPARIAASVAAGDRSAAAKAFFVEAIGVPAAGVAVMRMLPLWRDAKALTHTLRYDFAAARRAAAGPPAAGGALGRSDGADHRDGRIEEREVLPPHREEPGGTAARCRVRVARRRPPRLARDVSRRDRAAHHRKVRDPLSDRHRIGDDAWH